MLSDPSHVRANLSTATLDHYLDHYIAIWNQPVDGAVADAAAATPTTAAQAPPRKIVNIDFPTAASIPAVSIMNPEPVGKPVAPSAQGASANPTAASEAPKRARKQAANPAPSAPPATDAPVDPVWTPAPAAPPAGAVAATPTGTAAPGPNAPMQLMPSPPPQ